MFHITNKINNCNKVDKEINPPPNSPKSPIMNSSIFGISPGTEMDLLCILYKNYQLDDNFRLDGNVLK